MDKYITVEVDNLAAAEGTEKSDIRHGFRVTYAHNSTASSSRRPSGDDVEIRNTPGNPNVVTYTATTPVADIPYVQESATTAGYQGGNAVIPEGKKQDTKPRVMKLTDAVCIDVRGDPERIGQYTYQYENRGTRSVQRVINNLPPVMRVEVDDGGNRTKCHVDSTNMTMPDDFMACVYGVVRASEGAEWQYP